MMPMDICPYCQKGRLNALLNSETSAQTDLSVYVGYLNDAIIAKHYDIEGDTYDAVDVIPINFCPMCGRKLRE
jgi:hypothetical protein